MKLREKQQVWRLNQKISVQFLLFKSVGISLSMIDVRELDKISTDELLTLYNRNKKEILRLNKKRNELKEKLETF